MRSITEMINIMKAYNDGVEIEYRVPSAFDSSWKSCRNPEWNWQNADYRIKKSGFACEYMTNRELSELLAKGYGEWRYDDGDECHTTYEYSEDEQNNLVDEDVVIRAWREVDWKSPIKDIYNENILSSLKSSY